MARDGAEALRLVMMMVVMMMVMMLMMIVSVLVSNQCECCAFGGIKEC